MSVLCNTDSPPPKHNYAEIQYVQGKSRVVNLFCNAPLRLLHTAGYKAHVELVTSSFGGGFLQGDNVTLKLRCNENAKMVLRSQGNTHIYKNTDDRISVQNISGILEKNSVVSVCMDPVVMHKDAQFRQSQSWQLHQSSSLLLVEWLHSGRSESGERFMFDAFYSDVKLEVSGKSILDERFRCDCHLDAPDNFNRFAHLNIAMNIYLIGDRFEQIVELLQTYIASNSQCNRLGTLPLNDSQPINPIYYSMNRLPRGHGIVFRAISKTRKALDPLFDHLTKFIQ